VWHGRIARHRLALADVVRHPCLARRRGRRRRCAECPTTPTCRRARRLTDLGGPLIRLVRRSAERSHLTFGDGPGCRSWCPDPPASRQVARSMQLQAPTSTSSSMRTIRPADLPVHGASAVALEVEGEAEAVLRCPITHWAAGTTRCRHAQCSARPAPGQRMQSSPIRAPSSTGAGMQGGPRADLAVGPTYAPGEIQPSMDVRRLVDERAGLDAWLDHQPVMEQSAGPWRKRRTVVSPPAVQRLPEPARRPRRRRITAPVRGALKLLAVSADWRRTRSATDGRLQRRNSRDVAGAAPRSSAPMRRASSWTESCVWGVPTRELTSLAAEGWLFPAGGAACPWAGRREALVVTGAPPRWSRRRRRARTGSGLVEQRR